MMFEAYQVKPIILVEWEQLIVEFFPNAIKAGHYYTVGSLAGEPGGSLVFWTGAKAGAWKDYSADAQGDVFTLIMTVQRLSFPEAVQWAAAWCGLSERDDNWKVRRAEARRKTKARQAQATADNEENRKKAHGMWLHGRREVKGTAVDLYLAGRGIDLRLLGRQPGALRYHEACWHFQLNKQLPAMLWGVWDPSAPSKQRFRSVHRTYLQKVKGGHWQRIKTTKAVKGKLTKGIYLGAHIPVWRGDSGKPLVDMPEGERVYVTEGPEDALTLAISDPSARVICGVSLANMANIWLPPQVGPVVLLRDNDPGADAKAMFERAAAAHIEKGRDVREMLVPSAVGKDANDWLLAGKS